MTPLALGVALLALPVQAQVPVQDRARQQSASRAAVALPVRDSARVRQVVWTRLEAPPVMQRRLRQVTSLLARQPRPPDSLRTTLLNLLALAGHAEATLAVRQRRDTAHVQLVAGRMFWLDSLGLRGATPAQWLALGLPLRKPQPWSAAGMARWTSAMLETLADEGRPFAQLSVPQVQFLPGEAEAVRVRVVYEVTPGPLAVIDSVLPLGGIRERPRFVQGLIGVQPGQLYRARDLREAPNLLNNTAYYQHVKPPRVTFRPPPDRGNLGADDSSGFYRADVRIPMEVRKANRFDALLGILPPQGTLQQEWQVTALVDILLVSPLRGGEVLGFRYEQFPNQSRRVDLRLSVPNLFRSPLRAEVRFDLQRQDTSFLTVNLEPAAWWYFTPQLAARVFYRSRTSTFLAGQTRTGLVWPPPDVLDGRTAQWGIGLFYTRLDRRLNPRSGWQVDVDYAIGTKTIDRSPRLPDLDYARLRLTQPRRDLRLRGEYYYPVGRRQVLATTGIVQWVELPEAVSNDLVFVGGARSLRGFTENTFLASLWAQGSLEYRLLLDEVSYLAPFVDYALVKQRTLLNNRTWHPLGVGLSLNVGTAAGVINVTYAVGRSEDAPFRPAEGRVHIGFVSSF